LLLEKNLKDDDYQLLNWRIFQIYFTEVSETAKSDDKFQSFTKKVCLIITMQNI
jgi:hypothetical protein